MKRDTRYRVAPSRRARWAVAVLALGLAAPLARAAAIDVDQVTSDEALLKSVGVGVDGPGLLTFVRSQTPTDAELAEIAALARDLGDPVFRKRDRASRELPKRGAAALPALR